MQKSISAETFTEPSTYAERLMASLERLHSVLRSWRMQSIIKKLISEQFILLVVLVLLICYCPCCTIAWHHTLVKQLEQTVSVCDKRARGRKRSVALSKKLSMQQWRQKQKHGEKKKLWHLSQPVSVLIKKSANLSLFPRKHLIQLAIIGGRNSAIQLFFLSCNEYEYHIVPR
jgi:hypothetical protein